MKGYIINIENETLKNEDYRKVLYTAPNMQLVLMTLASGEEIGEETHELDQFIRVEAGEGTVVLNGAEHKVENGSAVVIPRGVKHNVKNTGEERLKLYTLYAPPEHMDGTLHARKSDEKEEHWDGVTTEEA